jgi:hypothetical protein
MTYETEDERALDEAHRRDEDHDATLEQSDRQAEQGGGGIDRTRLEYIGMEVDELWSRCEDDDDNACRELERRGIEPPVIPVSEVVEEAELTAFQTRVRDLLAGEWPSVGVGRTASGAAVFSCYSAAYKDDEPIGEPEGVVMIAANDTGTLVDGTEARRRIFLSHAGYAKVRDAEKLTEVFAGAVEVVEGGYAADVGPRGVGVLRELGIGIVNYVEGLTPEQAKEKYPEAFDGHVRGLADSIRKGRS